MIEIPHTNKQLPLSNDLIWVRTILPVKRRGFLRRKICSHWETTSFIASTVIGVHSTEVIRYVGWCCINCGTVLSCHEQDTFRSFMGDFGR